jgi:hypothetical protein
LLARHDPSNENGFTVNLGYRLAAMGKVVGSDRKDLRDLI